MIVQVFVRTPTGSLLSGNQHSAIHIIAIGRLRLDARTQDYLARGIAAGNSKLEAIRCLKRYIAHEVFAILMRRHKEINQTQMAA